MFENYERVETELVLPVGDYRVRIANAEKKTSRNGNDMIAIQFDVSGRKSKLFYNIVFIYGSEEERNRTNRNLTRFFDCFGISTADEKYKQIATWVGKVGAVRVKHDEYNGKTSAQVNFVLTREEANALPPWSEPNNGQVQISDGLEEVRDGTLPF